MPFSIIAALVAWLPEQVGVPCYAQVPKDRPASFCDVYRTGGGAGIGIDRPVVAVRCWADTAYNAEQLALKVRDAVSLRAGEIPGVWGARVNSGPYDSTESTRQPSSQVVFDITCEF